MARDPVRLAITVPVWDSPWAQALPVAARLRAAGFQAWCVGGCVRDALLKRAVHDIDLATDATPESVEGLFPRTIAVGKAFGVMVVVTEDGSKVEVATFRHDGRYLDGRRPDQVTFGSAEEDVARRDFTVNALLFDPIAGEIVDHVGGLADVEAHVVRCVGDARARLHEDRLRVLRALRFAAALGFSVEPTTWEAARATTIAGLSRERVMEEWRKALAGGPGVYLRLCAQAGRLAELTPPLQGLAPAEVEPAATALDRLIASGSPGAVLPTQACEDARLAAWLSPASADSAAAWLGTQPLERALSRRVGWLLHAHAQAGGFAALGVAERRRLCRAPGAPAWAALEQARRPGAAESAAIVAQVEREQGVGPLSALITGDDLLGLGVPAGRRIGELLRRCEDAQLAQELTTREDALAAARRWASER